MTEYIKKDDALKCCPMLVDGQGYEGGSRGMKIALDIPKEFEEHFNNDRFEDSLHRLCADAHLLAGNYEQETAIMLFKALKNAKEVVRCKDCQYSRKPDRTNMEENLACDGVLICFAGFDYVYPSYNREIFVSEDSFCSAGELKRGDAE